MIPLSRPYIDEEDIKAVVATLKSGFLSLGPKLKEFEQAFAKYLGIKHAVAVANGTCGLHLAVKSLNLNPGDEVITTPFSFVASSNCILYERAKPVFVDIDKETFNIDAAKIEQAITDKTKAILPVHIFGLPCEMDAIIKIAKENNLQIIEDSAEALGAVYNGKKHKNKKAGTLGLASVFAFYPNKQMTTGEGGMLCTDDEKVAKLCRSLRNQGRADSDEWLSHEYIGYNYRLDDISCALGLSQLKKIDFLLKERENAADIYNEQLQNIDGITIPIKTKHKRSWFVYVIKLNKNINRNKVAQELKNKGIRTKPYLPAIHLQPAYRKLGYKPGSLPVCEAVSSSTLALPFYTGMPKEHIYTVTKNLKGVLHKLG